MAILQILWPAFPAPVPAVPAPPQRGSQRNDSPKLQMYHKPPQQIIYHNFQISHLQFDEAPLHASTEHHVFFRPWTGHLACMLARTFLRTCHCRSDFQLPAKCPCPCSSATRLEGSRACGRLILVFAQTLFSQITWVWVSIDGFNHQSFGPQQISMQSTHVETLCLNWRRTRET